jgi:hypothetical protein
MHRGLFIFLFRHLLPNQARAEECIAALQRAHPDCTEHMPVV